MDDIIVSGGKPAYGKFFAQLKGRSLVTTQGPIRMYIDCAFTRDWELGMIEMNQTAYAENW